MTRDYTRIDPGEEHVSIRSDLDAAHFDCKIDRHFPPVRHDPPVAVQVAAQRTREDLGPDGKNYPDVRALLGYVEAAIKAPAARQQAPHIRDLELTAVREETLCTEPAPQFSDAELTAILEREFNGQLQGPPYIATDLEPVPSDFRYDLDTQGQEVIPAEPEKAEPPTGIVKWGGAMLLLILAAVALDRAGFWPWVRAAIWGRS